MNSTNYIHMTPKNHMHMISKNNIQLKQTAAKKYYSSFAGNRLHGKYIFHLCTAIFDLIIDNKIALKLVFETGESYTFNDFDYPSREFELNPFKTFNVELVKQLKGINLDSNYTFEQVDEIKTGFLKLGFNVSEDDIYTICTLIDDAGSLLDSLEIAGEQHSYDVNDYKLSSDGYAILKDSKNG